MPRQASSNGTTDPYRGRKIGKYEILTRLSVGGMAELFLAFTSGPGGFRKFVALKQILPDVKTEEFVKMFLDEARITAAFSHPNIGQVFDLGLEDDELYLAMEYLPGQNLEQVMMAASYVRPLPIGFAARVARDVCLGLHYAHNFTAPSGRKVAVVHRDMAPRNVMITYDGVVKVIDFGIAKAKGRIARTRVGMVKGTSGYMSPEQVRGQDLDGRSDLFTAGVLLHEMLVGQRLFDTTDEDAMMRQIANAEIAPPRANNPDVPEVLDAVVMKALAKDPSRRFTTGREMAKALEVAVGPDMFDEEAVAELMQALFADKRLKTLALLDDSSQDDERVSKVVSALQEEQTLDGSGSADDLHDSRTSPALAMPAQMPEPPPEPVRPPPSRSSSSSGRAVNPPKARPFPPPPRPTRRTPSLPRARSRRPGTSPRMRPPRSAPSRACWRGRTLPTSTRRSRPRPRPESPGAPRRWACSRSAGRAQGRGLRPGAHARRGGQRGLGAVQRVPRLAGLDRPPASRAPGALDRAGDGDPGPRGALHARVAEEQDQLAGVLALEHSAAPGRNHRAFLRGLRAATSLRGRPSRGARAEGFTRLGQPWRGAQASAPSAAQGGGAALRGPHSREPRRPGPQAGRPGSQARRPGPQGGRGGSPRALGSLGGPCGGGTLHPAA